MKFKLEKPIAVLDAETSGTDLANDRIVELSIHFWGKTEKFTQRFNPKRRQDPEAIKVHGITDEELLNEPTFDEKASEIYTMLEGCDIAGFNIERFDIPILVEEFLRCGYEFPQEEARIIDAFKIFRTQEPRDLEAAYKFYCGATVDKEAQHGSNYDTLITLAVLQGQSEKYKLSDVEALIAAGKSEKDLEIVDYAGKLARREDGQIVYNFGPGKGNLIKEDRGFGIWILNQTWVTRDTKRKLRKLLDE